MTRQIVEMVLVWDVVLSFASVDYVERGAARDQRICFDEWDDAAKWIREHLLAAPTHADVIVSRELVPIAEWEARKDVDDAPRAD